MKEIIVHQHPKSPVSEAYKGIRTNIQFANIDKNIKTILITSATPGEGKTITLTNLAVAMAQNNQKVLIVDCDMRKPRIHKALEISNQKGLADTLFEEKSDFDYIQHVELLNLDVMTSGRTPSNPSELLYSKAMKTLIEKFKESYDYIFFDSPPILPVTDAVIMSSYIDGVILVVTAGGIDFDVAKKAKQSLEAVNANILGVVLNKVKIEDQKEYQSYYYYHAKAEEE